MCFYVCCVYWLCILWCTSVNTPALGYSGHSPIFVHYNEGLVYYQTIWHSGNALNTYLEDAWFESRLGHRLS
jgi:hypothetical protein